MKQILRKGFVTLLLLSSAGFLILTLGESRRVENLRFPAHHGPSSQVDTVWSADPDMMNIVREVHKGLDSMLDPMLERANEIARTARFLFSYIADSIGELAGYIRTQNPSVTMESALVQSTAFLKYSSKYKVPLDLVVAVAHTESHFFPNARSPAGAAGVMQVMWKVHSGLLTANGIVSEEELHDPDKGIAAGTLLLSRYLKAHGDVQTALGRYYGGSASVYWSRVSQSLSKVRVLDLLAVLF